LPADLQLVVALATFGIVILLIALDWLDMTVAAMLGVTVYAATGILTQRAVTSGLEMASGPLALLFGGMVVARVLMPTGIFAVIGGRFLRMTGGDGRRLLLGLVCLIAPICAFLPNATVVLLMAPVIIRVAAALEVDFVPLLVLTAIVSNASGLLTLVGDPATFIVGTAIHLSFADYLARVSVGGLLSILVILPLLPWLFADVWRVRHPLPRDLPRPAFERPAFAVAALAALAVMIALFVIGEDLLHIAPPAVAIVGATLALLAIYGWKIEPVDRVFADIDWKTLIFLLCMFLMVQSLVVTGLFHSVSRNLADTFGTNVLAASMVLLVGVGVASSVLANMAVAVVTVLVVKGYLVLIDAVPEEALGQEYLQTWPASIVPVFVAIMFGATLGGNATVIGGSANVVAAGIAAKQGSRMSFARFARYGVPITLAQLATGAVYTLVLYLLIAR
jgi:Na+/H+ antiporter NhaD/arsenite permease-like protein